jgi:hypothetical protein
MGCFHKYVVAEDMALAGNIRIEFEFALSAFIRGGEF